MIISGYTIHLLYIIMMPFQNHCVTFKLYPFCRMLMLMDLSTLIYVRAYFHIIYIMILLKFFFIPYSLSS